MGERPRPRSASTARAAAPSCARPATAQESSLATWIEGCSRTTTREFASSGKRCTDRPLAPRDVRARLTFVTFQPSRLCSWASLLVALPPVLHCRILQDHDVRFPAKPKKERRKKK